MKKIIIPAVMYLVTGKIFECSVHFLGVTELLNENEELKKQWDLGEYCKVWCLVEEGFLIDGEFYNREETSKHLNLRCGSFAETEQLKQMQNQNSSGFWVYA